MKFRGKRYVFDQEWTPNDGIQLLQENVQFSPVKPAKLRTDRLKLDTVFCHLETKLYPILTLEEKMIVKTDWDQVRSKLEKLETSILSEMRMSDLPKQSGRAINFSTVPENLQRLVNEEEIPELEGCMLANESRFDESDVIEGQDVVIWTESCENRHDLNNIVSIVLRF